MPGSIRLIDTTSQRYDPVDSLPSSPEKPVDTERKRDIISQSNLPPSPADSDTAMRETSPGESPSATVREERRITRHIDRGAPGDQSIFSDTKTPEQKALARKKSQFYGDVFASREPNTSARERVLKESIVMADVRTNVIVSGHDIS